MIISVYTAAHWVPKILSERKVNTSPAHQLNDPFELSPKIDPVFYQSVAPTIYTTPDGKKTSFEVIGPELGYSNFERFCQDSWYWIPILIARIPKNIEAERKIFAEKFSRHFRLFFASKISDSILMWSHYGKNHTGCVIEFDTSFSFFSELKPITVKYRKARPDFTYQPGDKLAHERADAFHAPI